jgi:CRP/FNR family cyclic AMP-dependent transcriptional regulator
MTSTTELEANLKLLKKCQLFDALGEQAQMGLAAIAYRRHFVPGEQIFQIGAPGTSMMAVCAGTVRITFPSTTGKEIILADLAAGEVFGEISVLDGSQRSANAVAHSQSELLILERKDLVPFLESNPKICMKLLAVMCGRLRRTNELMADIAFYDLPKRLAKQLLRLRAPGSDAAGVQRKTKLSCSQNELANMIGGSRENVNRCLNEWQRRGIVNLDDGWIVLAEPAELEKLAEA